MRNQFFIGNLVSTTQSNIIPILFKGALKITLCPLTENLSCFLLLLKVSKRDNKCAGVNILYKIKNKKGRISREEAHRNRD